jgi:hypothetical protein
VAQFGIIVNNEDLTDIRHQFRPSQPAVRIAILLTNSMISIYHALALGAQLLPGVPSPLR